MRPALTFAVDYFRDSKNLVAVEIGVDIGGNAMEIYSALKGRLKVLYLVDPYLAQHQNENVPTRIEQMLTQILGNDKTMFFRLPSVDAARMFAPLGAQFDYVYIDGDHDYEMAMLDLIMWYPLVKNKGILAGHDWGHIPAVRAAVQDFMNHSGRHRGQICIGDHNKEDWWIVKDV